MAKPNHHSPKTDGWWGERNLPISSPWIDRLIGRASLWSTLATVIGAPGSTNRLSASSLKDLDQEGLPDIICKVGELCWDIGGFPRFKGNTVDFLNYIEMSRSTEDGQGRNCGVRQNQTFANIQATMYPSPTTKWGAVMKGTYMICSAEVSSPSDSAKAWTMRVVVWKVSGGAETGRPSSLVMSIWTQVEPTTHIQET